MDMAAKLVKKALARSSLTDDDIGDKVLKKRSSAEQIQQPVRPNLSTSHDDNFIFIVNLCS